MSTIDHRYFGELNSPGTETDVVWEREFTLGDARFDVALWMSPGERFDASMLDAFAALLDDLSALDAAARRRLKTYLEEDRSFIDYHTEEVDDSDVIAGLIDAANDAEIEADAFVAAMRVNGVGLWIGMSSSPVVLDYVIDAEHSDQILAVKTAQDGSVVSIDWES